MIQLHGFAAPPKKRSSLRIDIAPTIGLYTINTHHAIDPKPIPGLTAGFKKEFRMGHEFNTYFLVGIDYMFYGLSFKSYYFNPDSIKLYDKSFGYTYSLFVQEINIPFQFKYLLRREDNSLFSPYVAIGYHLRYLLPGSLKVKQRGEQVRSDNVDLAFKNPLFWNKLNASVSASLGWQKNHLSASARGSFFIELNFKYGFSAYSFQTNYSASSLYINGLQMGVVLGLKF